MLQFLVLPLLLSFSSALLPYPQSYEYADSFLTLSNDLSINAPENTLDTINAAVQAIHASAHRRLSIGLGSEDVDSITDATPSITALNVNIDSDISIQDIFNQPIDKRDESYYLDIPYSEDDITATINSANILGLHRALSTFQQLFYKHPSEDIHYLNNAPITINDSPEFGWRSVMLDTSRNYYKKESLLNLISTMSFVKLSVFHWHITDQHSWPLVTDVHPELYEKGSYPGMLYTQQDIEDVVEHGRSVGVDVVIELDLPGHTQSVAESHPDLISCIDRRPWSNYAAEPPAGQLNLQNDDVLPLVQSVLDDLLPRAPSKYFGTGGDELNPACYDMTLDELAPLVRSFQSSLSDKLDEFNKTAVVWHELSTEYEMPLEDGTLVINWSTADFTSQILASQPSTVSIIHAASDYMYLDCGTGGWLGNAPDGTSWCDPFKSWQKIYSFDAYANMAEEDKGRVAGGETTLWSEQADSANFESLIWPRAAAGAEVFWTHPDPQVRTDNADDALYRMHDIRYRLVDRDVRAAALQPLWCAVRPGKCNV
ncbi:hypothetical protein E3P99_02262 [Wallemia hederae]|uniref:Beta-hexosaminidase n=1 Tax=Wallemia hederae TaxID=1540922 RepID=A0A4T0FNC7_9BASI|nr:hypothetical protein E3P99_02262 [Wallemia hederae]